MFNNFKEQNKNSLIRAFIAVNLDDKAAVELDNFLNKLRLFNSNSNFSRIKWVTRPQFHITLRFLGEQTHDFIENVKHAIANIKFQPFNIELDYAGAFPNFNRPRVLWLSGKNGRDELIHLAKSVNNALLNAGIENEDRPFKPHLTLARIADFDRFERSERFERLEKFENSPLSPELLSELKNNVPMISWKCTNFDLMRSKLTPQGAIYSKINLYGKSASSPA